MKFSCEASTLLREITVAHEIITTRTMLGILSNVLLEAREDFLVIKASDLKVTFETKIPVTVEEAGTTTIFCDKLLVILRNFPTGTVHFIESSKEDGNVLEITDKKAIDYYLRSMTPDKFPEIPETSEEDYFSVSQKDMVEMINHTIFAISVDETRYSMNGVYLKKKENSILAVASDMRRLSCAKISSEAIIPEFREIIIPPKPLNLIRRLASCEGSIDIAVVDKTVFFRFDNRKITSSLIEGKYPQYERLIPEKQENSVIVSREEFYSALKRVSVLSEQRRREIVLFFSENQLKLQSEENDVGTAQESVSCKYNGPECKFHFNHVHLTEPLKSISQDKIEINFTNYEKPIRLTSEPVADFFHVITTLQLE